ncbi:TonB-dependent receptor [Sphingomonas sp. ID1715]|uniref:TonB-dependent receptor family protein n=1 Tax=Sphingomonas sp. ID1715 TaxID=1656898 RepID=UPI00148860CA|nr:TonB-dependent receptor [Sphingomonas sp. ID1715]NNM78142.1 TonB-dependent receptor [Sphingomonas sp. ID1715]
MIDLALGLAAAAAGLQDTRPGTIRVEGARPVPQQGTRPKLNHLLPEVDGTRITVTKKNSTTKLDQQPPVVETQGRELFARSPGVLVSEQQTPTQYNISYRGLGNPQEAEFVLVLQDGIPIQSDWIGFPTLFYVPLPQGLSEVQLIRGGSSLIYGPEPAPAINFVSKRPDPKGPAFRASTQQLAGSDGLYSTYNVAEGASGSFEYRAALGYTHSDGQRRNSASNLLQGDLYLGWRPSDRALWYVRVQGHSAEAGNPGRISQPQFLADQNFAPTPFNRDWVRRGAVILGNELELGDGWRLEGKAWASTLQLYTRAAAAGANPATTTLQDEYFHNEGLDIRARKRWGRGNAFTFGVTGTHSDAPFKQFTSTNIKADRGDHGGTPRLDQARDSWYGAVFAENVFRLPHRFHVVLSGRLDVEKLRIRETVRPPNLTRPLANVEVSRTVPLLGVGIGNDFGKDNETYLSITQGYRPLRYFDVASPFSNLRPGREADAPSSTSYEAGVHGTPLTGLFYDVSLFQINFSNRIESRRLNATDVINVNTGDTRHRGFEGEVHYDFLAGRRSAEHLTAFVNLSLLDAKFVDSDNPAQIGKRPAFAPKSIVKGGITWRETGKYSLALTGLAVSAQYFQDSNLPVGSGASLVPAKVPGYRVFDLAGEWTVLPHVRLQGGVQNLFNEKYYARVFQTGLEPGRRRAIYGGIQADF